MAHPNRKKTFAVALSTVLALVAALAPTASADGLRSCTQAQKGQECDLELDLSYTPVLGWGKTQSDNAWICTPPPPVQTETYHSGCTIELPGGLQLICVSVTVIGRAAGVGSVTVTGHCNPVPFATCTANTGLFGFGTCTASHVNAGLFPPTCDVTLSGAVAGGGVCLFTFAVF